MALLTSRSSTAAKNSGAVLIVCLLLMVPLLLLGIGAMESAVLGERMAANAEDRGRAFGAAETALKTGEAWLKAQAFLPVATDSGKQGVWREGVLDAAFPEGTAWWQQSAADANWWASHGTAVASDSSVAAPAHYVIEQYRFVTDGESAGVGTGGLQPVVVFHRITALGVGRRATTRVRLQSTFVRPYER